MLISKGAAGISTIFVDIPLFYFILFYFGLPYYFVASGLRQGGRKEDGTPCEEHHMPVLQALPRQQDILGDGRDGRKGLQARVNIQSKDTLPSGRGGETWTKKDVYLSTVITRGGQVPLLHLHISRPVWVLHQTRGGQPIPPVPPQAKPPQAYCQAARRGETDAQGCPSGKGCCWCGL